MEQVQTVSPEVAELICSLGLSEGQRNAVIELALREASARQQEEEENEELFSQVQEETLNDWHMAFMVAGMVTGNWHQEKAKQIVRHGDSWTTTLLKTAQETRQVATALFHALQAGPLSPGEIKDVGCAPGGKIPDLFHSTVTEGIWP